MIVVTTPTGQIGQQVLQLLTARGAEPVRVVARDPSKLSEQLRERVEVVQGSHDDPDVLARALAGADALFFLVPPDARASDPMEHYLGFARPAARAITDAGVARVVAVSSLGHGWPRDAGMLTPAFAMDDVLAATGTAYRSLRMPYFMENLLQQVPALRQGTWAGPNAADRPLATVATRDVGPVAASLLLDGSWSGQDAVPVIGPDDLTPDAMAQVITETLGRPVSYRQVPADAYQDTLTQHGLTVGWAHAVVRMATAQDQGIYDVEVAATGDGGRAPTGFREWCHEVLVPAVSS